ncbi:Marginal Zone B- And B1-Cell-Specific Protein [Manis pentadactyla]|nr:Marginal Zone B- And B1-Cell-Specific Protein [Manis pentadactyla]
MVKAKYLVHGSGLGFRFSVRYEYGGDRFTVRFGSISDVKASARLSFSFKTLQLMAAFQGECAIQFQDYSVAKVISMMRLEFPGLWSTLGLGLCNR